MPGKTKRAKYTKLDKKIFDLIPQKYYPNNKEVFRSAVSALSNRKLYEQKDYDVYGKGTGAGSDLFQLALGYSGPLEFVERSQYKPSVSKDPNAKYYRIKNLDRTNFLIGALEELGENDKVISSGMVASKDKRNTHGLGDYTISKGEDKRGKYVSYYDKYDFNNNLVTKYLDRQPEVYDRVYYTDNPYYKEYEKIDHIQDSLWNTGTQKNRRKSMAMFSDIDKLLDSAKREGSSLRSPYMPVEETVIHTPSDDDISKFLPSINSLNKKQTNNTMGPVKQKMSLGGAIDITQFMNMFQGAGADQGMGRFGTAFNNIKQGIGNMQQGNGMTGNITVPTSATNGISSMAGAIPYIGKAASAIFGVLEQSRFNKWNEDQQRITLQKDRAQQLSGIESSIQNPYAATFARGGIVPNDLATLMERQDAPNLPILTPGMPQDQVAVELEKQEVFQTPSGMMGKVNGPSHAQGGVDLNLPGGTFVWSDKLKSATGKTFAEEAAKLAKLKAKYEKILRKNNEY